MQLTIGYLYSDLMNIYGDTGNIITLQKRAEWRGIEVKIRNISVGDKLKVGEVDLYFFGGGQDQAQELVAKDLLKSDKGKVIKAEVEKGVPLLSICGGYQLLGEYYQPHEGPKLEGINLFPVYTEASYDRMIGNIVIEVTPQKNIQLDHQIVVGFENHSGKTYLKNGGQALGTVIKGFGNNGQDQTEGCIFKNAIGCYMHGSLLPKNPQLSDWFLQQALEHKYGEKVNLKPLDDEIEEHAHQKAVSRFG
jgi:lipid II isoglutaminyl synthase (glutamine-hydrolysing)